MQKSLWVYILKCSDNSYYVGVTNDLDRRVWEHNNDPNITSYTYSRRPAELVYCVSFTEHTDAIMYEKTIKDWSRKKKEALINGEYHLLPMLSYSKSYPENKMKKQKAKQQ